MLEFADIIKDIHPGIFVYSIYMSDDAQRDSRAGFYGNVNAQIEFAAAQLANVSELSGGFDALGFSQGGQFLRAYAERFNNPPVHNLITFGSQHMGVSDLPTCRPADLTCQLARRAARASVYGRWVQENIVQAQYFRDPTRLPLYRNVNNFLADINNEYGPGTHNSTYKHNLGSLNALVLVLFTRDKTVVPKESAWFGAFAPPDGAELAWTQKQQPLHPEAQSVMETQSVSTEPVVLPMRQQPLYKEDWVGLRTLDEAGKVHLSACDGEHMQLPPVCYEGIVKKWCGGKIE
jgi:palmitoyl-protein thioesterase